MGGLPLTKMSLEGAGDPLSHSVVISQASQADGPGRGPGLARGGPPKPAPPSLGTLRATQPKVPATRACHTTLSQIQSPPQSSPLPSPGEMGEGLLRAGECLPLAESCRGRPGLLAPSEFAPHCRAASVGLVDH